MTHGTSLTKHKSRKFDHREDNGNDDKIKEEYHGGDNTTKLKLDYKKRCKNVAVNDASMQSPPSMKMRNSMAQGQPCWILYHPQGQAYQHSQRPEHRE